MITIKITNAHDLLRKEKSRLVARLAPYFVDVELKVEEMIAARIEEAFREKDVRAVITVEREKKAG